MKKLGITLIIDQQSSPEKASKVAGLVKATLHLDDKLDVIKYDKFPDAYKIELSGKINSDHSIETVIELADRICSPWLVYYDHDSKEAELVFNRDKNSCFRKQNFNALRWAHFNILG